MAFAFDPHVGEEVKRYGLQVHPVRINNDLTSGMGEPKKTAAANLFMIFGELDITIRPAKPAEMLKDEAGKAADYLVAEIRGLMSTTHRAARSGSSTTDEIACWFIDTDYNEESFFVRHAYFTGAAKDGEGPYERLKRALRAEINEEAWSALYSTVSRPFPKPKGKAGKPGKIGVKVINHFGDEVLQVIKLD